MAIYTINKRQLLELAFGLTGLSIYNVQGGELPEGSGGPVGSVGVDLSTEYDGTSSLGLPVYMNVSFPDGQYQDNNLQIAYTGMVLVDCVVDVTATKNIVSTPIAGRRGTVKELISIGDYQVTIKGLLVSDNRFKAPQDQIKQLKALFEVPAAINVVGKIFEWMGIYKLALQNLNLPKLQGNINVQPFEITALSDLPIELVFEEEFDV